MNRTHEALGRFQVNDIVDGQDADGIGFGNLIRIERFKFFFKVICFEILEPLYRFLFIKIGLIDIGNGIGNHIGTKCSRQHQI